MIYKVICKPSESTVGYFNNPDDIELAIRDYMAAPAAKGLTPEDFIIEIVS